MKEKALGFNSPVCTWPRCRKSLDYGAGIQILIDGVEHRLCTEHHSKYMNEGAKP